MIGLIDDTYAHGFERREEVSDTIYNFGGYPHGYYSSAYNAGYGSTALRGEEYRDAGIKAYQFMIQNAMSGPFGWWEVLTIRVMIHRGMSRMQKAAAVLASICGDNLLLPKF